MKRTAMTDVGKVDGNLIRTYMANMPQEQTKPVNKTSMSANQSTGQVDLKYMPTKTDLVKIPAQVREENEIESKALNEINIRNLEQNLEFLNDKLKRCIR